MDSFEFLEHTADVAIRVYGKNLEELFINSAKALFSLTSDYQPKETESRQISLESDVLEDLLAYWLNELLSIFYTYCFIPKFYNIKVENHNIKTIEGTLKGSPFDFDKDTIKMEIKAATYHNLRIEKNDKGYRVDIIFDV